MMVGHEPTVRNKVHAFYHESSLGGNSGITSTWHCVKQDFYWKVLKHDVYQFIREYDVFQKCKGENIASPGLLQNIANPGLLQPLPIPNMVWHDISITSSRDYLELMARK